MKNSRNIITLRRVLTSRCMDQGSEDEEALVDRGPPVFLLVQFLATLMTLGCVNSSSPSWPISAPIPDCFAAANGMSGGRSRCLLTQTVPESICAATSYARFRSEPQ